MTDQADNNQKSTDGGCAGLAVMLLFIGFAALIVVAVLGEMNR